MISKSNETVEQINETRSWFFERTNKIGKPLARLMKQKKERTQINKIKKERGEITTNTAEIQTIVRKYMSNYTPKKWAMWTKWTNS